MKATRFYSNKFHFFIFAFALISTLVLVRVTHLVPHWGMWYSSCNEYRLQVEAFLQGRFFVRDHPFFHAHDWAWGLYGLHQTWGLGVPILLTVPELISRALGHPYFPELLLFPILIAGWVMVLGQLCSILGRSFWHRVLLLAGGVGLVLFSRQFIDLLSSRFWFYEQASTASTLFALLQLFLLLIALLKRQVRWAVAAACASSLSPFLRAPGLSFAFATALMTMFLIWRLRRSALAAVFGALPAALGVGLFMLSNYLRFGGLLNAGHFTCFSRATYELHTEAVDMYALRFGSPFQKEPLFSALKEMLGFAFFGPNCAWQSPTFRLRWEDIIGYQAIHLVLLIVSVGITSYLFFVRSKKGGWLRPEVVQAVFLIACWSVLAFVPFFFFYVKLHMISSRYMLDSYPSVAALIWVVLIVLAEFAIGKPRLLPRSMALCATLFIIFALSSPLFPARLPAAGGGGPPDAVRRAAVIPDMEWQKTVVSRPTSFLPPSSYECKGEGSDGQFKNFLPYDSQGWTIRYNLLGWGIKSDCRVHYATQAFLTPSRCYQVTLSSDDPKEKYENISLVSQTDRLVLSDSKDVERGHKVLRQMTFCRSHPAPQGASPWTLVSVGVTAPEDLGKVPSEKMPKLLSLKSVE